MSFPVLVKSRFILFFLHCLHLTKSRFSKSKGVAYQKCYQYRCRRMQCSKARWLFIHSRCWCYLFPPTLQLTCYNIGLVKLLRSHKQRTTREKLSTWSDRYILSIRWRKAANIGLLSGTECRAGKTTFLVICQLGTPGLWTRSPLPGWSNLSPAALRFPFGCLKRCRHLTSWRKDPVLQYRRPAALLPPVIRIAWKF